MSRRIRRFVRTWRSLSGPDRWTRHNIRALWIQSDPGWLSKLPAIGLTDEEWERFMEALK